ncbi:MAG: SAM-dependent methyltransferase [Candidatus Pelethousia sp.]|nr:SAM-dependent methyltransferase [Candidatus Pelethousia sp.]
MEEFKVKKIGVIRADEAGMRLELDKQFAPALTGMEGFSHLNILWWFSECDSDPCRNRLTERSPYKKAPAIMGTFATRSPERPNPIALSCAQVIYIDHQNAVIGLAYIDANDGTPVLDIKPYTPSLDRVESPSVPAWCADWPKCCEDSGDFNWESVFNF